MRPAPSRPTNTGPNLTEQTMCRNRGILHPRKRRLRRGSWALRGYSCTYIILYYAHEVAGTNAWGCVGKRWYTLPVHEPCHNVSELGPSARSFMMIMRSSMIILTLFSSGVTAHGAVTIPPPRQSIDGVLLPWSGAVPEFLPCSTVRSHRQLALAT
jgi:hypothetical protein